MAGIQYPCPYEACTLTFSYSRKLQSHIKHHQGIREFQCTQCDRSFFWRQTLHKHVMKEHKNRKCKEHSLYYCDHCKHPFRTMWGLRRHQIKLKKANYPSRKYPCQICSCKFSTAEDLNSHSFRHQQFSCDVQICPWSTHKFKKWSNYQRHMEKFHSKPFECEYCGFQFPIKSQIRHHVKQHMPMDMVFCTYTGCKKEFISVINMTNHVLITHGHKRTFKCDVVGCDWTFKYKRCLNRHVRTHQRNGKITPMASRLLKKKKTINKTANKLALLAFKIL